MLSNIKQGIGNTLTRFRKAINPIRWLGYVRPDELPQPFFSDTHSKELRDSITETEVLHSQIHKLEDTIRDLESRLDDCSDDDDC